MSSTHFGYRSVPEEDKARHVAKVFDSVAENYDLMNDLMSLGLHRVWKRFAVAALAIRPGERLLDIAGGSGDISWLALKAGADVVLTDINGAMLGVGRDRLLDQGHRVPVVQCDAEALPFAGAAFDCVSVAFGLRNMTHKDRALAEMRRMLRPGGRLLVLEFSKVARPLAPLYDAYSFGVLPRLGRLIAGDEASYRYLAESIRMHPGQQELAELMRQAGFDQVDYHNLNAGVVAAHLGRVY